MRNRREILAKIHKLIDLWDKKQIPTMTTQHEVNPGLEKSERLNYVYFTLPPSLNFQRSSPAMWQAALKTWEDSETNYLFYPERVVEQSFEKLSKDLTKHRLGLQPNKHTEIWQKLSITLNKLYKNDPREVLRTADYDVRKILDLLQQTNKKDFPYISGAKMVNYWLYILSKYTDVKLQNMQEISIIPDTHVMQCTIKLGMADKELPPEKTAALWKEVLAGTDIYPVNLHPVLWNWSRADFEPAV